MTSRGNQQKAIYNTDADRLVWLETLATACERFNWRCHAWCMMDNHYHIVIETIEGNLSKGMRHLNGVFTQKMNQLNNRVGHVFQGRYKAIIVDQDSYLLELSRYVVLNPVRAIMVNDIKDWKWSSYHSMIGNELIPKWLEVDWLLSHFSKSRKQAQQQYINFVREGIGLSPIWEQTKKAGFLADATFIDNAIQKNQKENGSNDLKEVSRLQRRVLAKALIWYDENNANKKDGMAQAYLSGSYTMKEIAEWFKVHYSTVSRAVKNYGMRDFKT